MFLKRHLGKNADVARIHSGDPSIYGAMQEQMHALDELEIPYEVIPGVSSFVGAAAALKQELTLPGTTQTIVITRMEGKTPIPEKEHLGKLATTTPTLCIFLSIDKIDEVVKILIPHYGKTALWPWYIRQPGLIRRLYAVNSLILLKRLNRNQLKSQHSSIVGWVFEKEFKRSVLYTQDWEKAKNHQYS